MGERERIPPSRRAHRPACRRHGVRPGLPAGSGASLSGCGARRAGLLPRADRRRRAAHRGQRDSAGGGLALGLLHWASAAGSGLDVVPVGAAVLSPVTDLSLDGESWDSRAEADPYFTRAQVVELLRAYLAGHDATDPLASPLHVDSTGLPPLRVHVGDAETLLDDSRRYVARAVAAGVDATLDVWGGMPHGFAGGVGRIAAAGAALAAIGVFLAERLAGHRKG